MSKEKSSLEEKQKQEIITEAKKIVEYSIQQILEGVQVDPYEYREKANATAVLTVNDVQYLVHMSAKKKVGQSFKPLALLVTQLHEAGEAVFSNGNQIDRNRYLCDAMLRMRSSTSSSPDEVLVLFWDSGSLIKPDKNYLDDRLQIIHFVYSAIQEGRLDLQEDFQELNTERPPQQ